MKKYSKVVLFGFFIWLIPFVVSFLIFPIRESQRALFESIIPVVVTVDDMPCKPRAPELQAVS